MDTPKPTPEDPNVDDLREMLLQRARIGLGKYGVTTNRQDIDLKGWLQHALEEALDQCVYLRAAIRKLEEMEAAKPIPQPTPPPDPYESWRVSDLEPTDPEAVERQRSSFDALMQRMFPNAQQPEAPQP